ncbi:MAG: 2OG-Fe(II) oxygenase [Proteobacteria bacterium]|nr:2OG-Fe(II) oxygenase [Pseudomonadota bacterium]
MAAGLSVPAAEPAIPASIPVIDIGALYGDDKAAKAAVAAKIGAACDDSGFFYVVNHNVPLATIENAVATVDRFFALPEAERLKVKADSNNRGYRDIWDSVHRNGKTNAKDSFDLGFPVAADDPEVKAGTPLYAPNNWPDMPGFREAVETYYLETYRLGMKILEGFALYLGKPEDFFTQHFTKPVADMVINHYLGSAGLHVSDQASGPHTDHGVVTILWQDMLGGLEVMGKDGQWMAAPPLRGSYVINIGELMKRWTNGRFQATVHRVVHLRDMPRYSMPLFCNPNFRTMVDPRDLGVSDAEAQYEPVMSGEFLLSRFKATRKLWGAEKQDGVTEDPYLVEAAAE